MQTLMEMKNEEALGGHEKPRLGGCPTAAPPLAHQQLHQFGIGTQCQPGQPQKRMLVRECGLLEQRPNQLRSSG